MFNKNAKAKEKKAPAATPLEVVLEIHSKVLSSGDDCLKAAQAILQTQGAEEIELFEKMKQKGFGNTKEIKEKEAEIKKQAEARERARIISGYAVRYPHKKFISTEEMDKICTEYKLIMGADQHYTGSIPVRSMKEIVDFKLHELDEIYWEGTWRAIESLKADKTKGVIDWKKCTKEHYMTRTNGGKVLVHNGKRTHFLSNKDYCMVVAPQSMFQIEGMKLEGNQLKKIVEADDPICLKPVDYGYIVVAVWGEELAIERMRNEKMN